MGHSIRGFVFRDAIPTPQLDRLEGTIRVSLSAGFVFVPLTNALYDEIVRADLEKAANRHAALVYLSKAVEELAVEQSRQGPVAYIETNYFGGIGDQAAVAWAAGEMCTPPQRAEIGPINTALESIGVAQRADGDAFETVSLQKIRTMDDWNYPDGAED